MKRRMKMLLLAIVDPTPAPAIDGHTSKVVLPSESEPDARASYLIAVTPS